jgi:glycosyltransferase involved in cell wall biosynthesis
LGSVRGIFDEIVVVDTGSVDRTREIAREHGAKVFEFAWIDDFAAARNAALDHATGDYAFWLDADDVIEPGEREKLVALLEGLDGASGGRASERAGIETMARAEPRPPGGDVARAEPVTRHQVSCEIPTRKFRLVHAPC